MGTETDLSRKYGYRLLVRPASRSSELVELTVTGVSPSGHVHVTFPHGTSRWLMREEANRYIIEDVLGPVEVTADD